MTLAQRGLYITLLALQWNQGFVSQDDFESLVGDGTAIAEPMAKRVLAKFAKGDDGHYRNQRLEVERRKQDAFRVNRSLSGKAGASKRWHSHSTAMAQPMANDSSPSPSPSPKRESSSALAPAYAETPSWSEFWAYCRSQGLVAEFYAKDKFLAAEQDNWDRKRNWRSYANRCKTWWEADGRPMQPKPKTTNGTHQPQPLRKYGDHRDCM